MKTNGPYVLRMLLCAPIYWTTVLSDGIVRPAVEGWQWTGIITRGANARARGSMTAFGSPHCARRCDSVVGRRRHRYREEGQVNFRLRRICSARTTSWLLAIAVVLSFGS